MKNAAKSWGKVWIATVLGMWLADGADIFNIDRGDIRLYLAAGASAVVPLIITWLDKNDPRFGRQ